jgi:hypothetical protein
MTTGTWRKGVALMLALAFPASLIAADSQGAMIYATNSVIVNGSQMSKTSSIFPGDKLTVPGDSTAKIMLKGSSILVPKSTTITFAGDSVSLEHQAAVAVDTTMGLAARVNEIKISPAKDGKAHYQVARFNGQVFIAAKQGSVLIASASGDRVLNEGGTATVPDPTPQAPVPPTTGGGGAGEIPTWVAVLIGAAAAGIAAGVAVATTGSPSSPATP